MTITPDSDNKYPTDKQRAFKRYKDATAESGKPFFPHGVYHDVIAATITMAIIIGLTIVWFAQANCDSWVNVSCSKVASPAAQEQYHPGEPSKVELTATGEPKEGLDGPLLGPLYEDKADPATTSYHPRPEWYFYFLFYLLIVFSNPQLVILGTIGVPTIFLILLIALPFIDRKTERRPSRRPLAMAAMIGTAITLLAFTYQGSKAGEKDAPEGLTGAQVEMPGYALIFEDARSETCFGCHVIVTGSGNIGPDLTEEGTLNRGLDWQIRHLADPKSESPGSTMPPQEGVFSPEELAQMGAFLETLGKPERSEDPKYTDAGEEQAEAALSGGGQAEEANIDPAGGGDSSGAGSEH